MPILTSANNVVVKQRFPFGKQKITIGRHPRCDIHIDDGSVSRMHAIIDYRDDAYFVEDLESRNGTFLNDRRINGSTKLTDGAEIKICDIMFKFLLSESESLRKQEETMKVSEKPDSVLSSVILQDLPMSKLDTQFSKIAPSSHYSQKHQRVSAEDKLRTLINVAHTLSESLERDEILSRILDFLFEHFVEADRGFIILKTADGSLKPLGCKTRRPQDDEQIRISKTIVNQVMESRCPVITSDALSDQRFDVSQSVMDFRIRSLMCAPLVNSHDQSIGVVQLDTLRPSVVFAEEDLELLATIAMQASFAIQKADLFDEAKRSRDMKQDLALANELQSRFLPQKSPAVEGYDFAAFYRPMQQVGGDYFDYICLDEDHLAIVVADVVGHGIAAAMLMAKVSAEMRFALASTKSAAAAMDLLNGKLIDMQLNRFVTIVLCLLNTKKNTVEIVNAGHMPPIVRHAKTGELIQLPLEDSGVPVGVLAGFEYESKTIQLAEGDVVTLYTDGMNEAMDVDGNQLTTERMLSAVEKSQVKTAETVNRIICDEVNRHMGTVNPIDDMCLVCFGRQG